MKWRSAWPIFHARVILPYILKTIWRMNIILLDYESVWADVWPLNKCRSLWPIFYGPVILPYILKSIWCMNIILWDYESVWHDIWPKNKCRSLWPIFHGPVILPYILKTIWYMNVILWDYESVYPMFDLKIFVGHCDPYFMVQWFCLYLENYSVAEHHTLGLWVSMTRHLTSKYLWVSDLYFMSHWICLISWKTVWCMHIILWDYESVWHNICLEINVGHCDLYFMVKWFCHILNSIWWMSYFWKMSQVSVIRLLTSK